MKPVFYAEDRSRRTGLLWSYAKEPTGPPVSKDRPEEPAGPSAGSFGPVPPLFRKTGERINSSFFFLSLPSLFLWRKAYESPAEEALPSVPYIERERYEVTKSRSTLSMQGTEGTALFPSSQKESGLLSRVSLCRNVFPGNIWVFYILS